MKEERTNKKVSRLIYQWMCIVALVACIVLYTVGRFSSPVSFKHSLALYIITTISLVFALIYISFEYKKNVSLFYKLFIGFYTVSQLFKFPSAIKMGGLFEVILIAITFGMLCVLLIALNLGKWKSLSLACVVVVCSVCHLVKMFVSPTGKNAMNLGGIAYFVLSVVLLMVILAKYIDKDERGTI